MKWPGIWPKSALLRFRLKAEDRDAFTQGVEKFIDAMEGKECSTWYTSLCHARVLPPSSPAMSNWHLHCRDMARYSFPFHKVIAKLLVSPWLEAFQCLPWKVCHMGANSKYSSTRTTSTSETKTTGWNVAPGVGIGAAIRLLMTGGNPMGHVGWGHRGKRSLIQHFKVKNWNKCKCRIARSG